MEIKELLKQATLKLKENNIEEAHSKAKRLLAFALDVSKEYLLVNYAQELNTLQINKYNKYIDEILQGRPLQYIIGMQEFMGINFKVSEDVLIPQPDTEILVEETIKIAKEFNNPKILDLCTGSGAIAISLLKYYEKAEIIATDISKKALEIAKYNDKKSKIKFIESDLFENVNEKFDIIVSNPPYIKTEEIKTLSKEVKNEPIIALDGGQDGLKFYKHIIKHAKNYLNESGYLCLEIGEDQKKEVNNLLEDNKYTQIKTIKDLSGHNRAIICKR